MNMFETICGVFAAVVYCVVMTWLGIVVLLQTIEGEKRWYQQEVNCDGDEDHEASDHQGDLAILHGESRGSPILDS